MNYVCCGMKRSGSTLQYNYLRGLLDAADVSYENCGYCSGEESVDLLSSSGPRLIKTHDVERFVGDGNCNATLFYTFRDLRDVFLSGKVKVGWDIASVETVIPELIGSYRQALACKNILLQRYESIYENPVAAVWEIARHAGLGVSNDQVQGIVQSQRPAPAPAIIKAYLNLRAMGRRLSHVSPAISLLVSPLRRANSCFFQKYAIDPRTQLHVDHVSKRGGKPGAWMQDLPAEEQELINTRYTDEIREMGYEVR